MTDRRKTHLQLLQNGRSLFNLAALLLNAGQRLGESRALDLYINLHGTTHNSTLSVILIMRAGGSQNIITHEDRL